MVQTIAGLAHPASDREKRWPRRKVDKPRKGSIGLCPARISEEQVVWFAAITTVGRSALPFPARWIPVGTWRCLFQAAPLTGALSALHRVTIQAVVALNCFEWNALWRIDLYPAATWLMTSMVCGCRPADPESSFDELYLIDGADHLCRFCSVRDSIDRRDRSRYRRSLRWQLKLVSPHPTRSRAPSLNA